MSRLLGTIPRAGFADGSVAHVELWSSPEPVAEDTVFAAMAVVTDVAGRYAVAWSPRRQEWGIPGGWREAGESVVECVLREVWEETGLVLEPADLRACGHEDLTPVSAHGVWPPDGGSMQLFRIQIPVVGPDLLAAEPDAVDPQWMSAAEFEALSGGQFWWPLIAAAMAEAG